MTLAHTPVQSTVAQLEQLAALHKPGPVGLAAEAEMLAAQECTDAAQALALYNLAARLEVAAKAMRAAVKGYADANPDKPVINETGMVFSCEQRAGHKSLLAYSQLTESQVQTVTALGLVKDVPGYPVWQFKKR